LFAALQRVSIVVKVAFHIFGVTVAILSLYQLVLVLRAGECANTITALYTFLYISSVVGVILAGESASSDRFHMD